MHSALLLAALLAAPALHAAGDAGGAPGDLLEAGRRLYEQGLRVDGGPLEAQAAGGVTLQGSGAACIACHRRSGEGSREGESRIAPITGPALYSPPAFHLPARPGEQPHPVVPPRRASRSAYDDASLARAIRSGLDPDGHRLDALMPRYALGEADAAALVAWLRELGSQVDPGVEPGRLRLAIVIAGEVDPARRAAYLSVLQAWASRGIVSGLETPLEVWTLQGDPAGWHSQLAALQARQPVFAVVSGLSAAGWEPVQDFCDEQSLPCLFPLLDFGPEPRAGGYAYLLSSGARLEAQALAGWLDDQGHPAVRLLAEGAAGQAAAAQFLGDYGTATADADPANATTWVAWGNAVDAERWLRELPPGTKLYLSAQLAPPEEVHVPPALRGQVRWISSRIDPRNLQALARIEAAPWLRSLGLGPIDDSTAVELRLATWLVADALARMGGRWRRDLLLESIESGMHAPQSARLFEGFSRAPGQRLLVRGARVLGWRDPAGDAPVALGSLLLP